MTTKGSKRVLLLGATGMLGAHLAKVLPVHFTTYSAVPRNNETFSLSESINWLTTCLDLNKQEGLDTLVQECAPDVIINCIAVTLNSKVALDPIENIRVNSLFPHLLAKAARKNGCRLIHFSTDGVFSGNRGNYSEDDLPDPPDIYGRSKLLGEVIDGNCLTLRTTFYGLSTNNKGLLDWLVSQKGGNVRGYKNYIFSGISLGVLASAIVEIIRMPIFPNGLYHLGGSPISKFDLLVMVSKSFNLNISVEPVFAPVINRSLNSSRFWKLIDQDTPQFVTMIDEMNVEYLQSRM